MIIVHERVEREAGERDTWLTSLHTKTAADAKSALEHVTDMLLRDRDRLAAFPEVYSVITCRVAAEVERPGGAFLEPEWISRLAGRFCARYLETLRWARAGHPQDTSAWACAYAAESRGAPPVVHALLGLSAHINYDLAVGIHATIVETGHGTDRQMLARYKHDHDQLNAMLDASIPEAFERLITRHCCKATVWLRRAGRLTRWSIMKLLVRWRGRVWDEVEALLAAQTSDQQARVLRSMARRAGRIGAILRGPRPAFWSCVSAPLVSLSGGGT